MFELTETKDEDDEIDVVVHMIVAQEVMNMIRKWIIPATEYTGE